MEESGQASLRRCPGRLRRKQACEEPGTGRVLQSPASAKTPRRQGAGVKGQRFREKLQEIRLESQWELGEELIIQELWAIHWASLLCWVGPSGQPTDNLQE